MDKKVFIQTNERQWLGALVAAYSLKRNSAHPDEFDVQIMHVKDFPFLQEKEGQSFLRGGASRIWQMSDLQSFTPLRFMPPKLMGHRGRAVVIDPDIFAVGDIFELLTREMGGKAVMGRHRSDKPDKAWQIATSVMLMDCEKLRHWEPEKEFDELFQFKRDYKDWIVLRHEPRENVGYLENEWNDFDRLTDRTKLLHNTKRRTQPWKTGLPVDFVPADKLRKYPLLPQLNRLRVRVFGEYGLLGRYKVHPDPKQEQFFFGLLRECLEKGVIDEAVVREEMRQNHVRHDALELVERTPALAA
ncbi:MAG: hypothetical protein AMJ59_02210 [Gammaproteobacteria bacterium SG8_31]|jgi:hypothetical protein|nr:MAG: hypothetical protein AMJ59_02210 [Gammaproteobacteria bacterium SG8_31]